MRSTLETVALLAGVSKSTVSRAINNDERVLPETRDRVLEAAATLKYRPNRNASALRTQRTGLLGLVVNSLYNATFNTIAEVIQARAGDAGYQVLVATSQGDADREAAFLDMADEHHFEGVIVAGSGRNTARINSLIERGIAVVTMNREVAGTEAPSVMTDYRNAARLATSHLIDQGHRRLATIGGLDSFTSGREHHLGFVEALGEAGLAFDQRLVHRGPFSPDFGQQAMAALLELKDLPTALLVTNHEATFGVLPTLTERGVSVPDDLSVACTEDAPWFSWLHPRLTVVDNRAADLGATALEMLISRLKGSMVGTGEHRRFEPRMIKRESTRPPR